MCEKIFSVLGESQFGKSSFINMISGTSTQRVGPGDGNSCTKQIRSVLFTDVLGIFRINAKLCCLDVPGFNDTSLDISNKQTLDNVKLTLVENECRKLDALFLFQSAFESALHLAKLFETAESLFGHAIVRSCVIIATKSDIVSSKLLPKRRETIESFAGTKNVPVVWWVNDSDEAVPLATKQKQAANLKRTLARVQAYNMTDMHDYEEQVRVRAEKLMNLDSSNKVTKQIKVPYDETVTYEVEETYEVPVVRQRFSEYEIRRRALYLQSLPENQIPYRVNVPVVYRVKKYVTYPSTERVVWKKSFLFFSWDKVEYRPVKRYVEVDGFERGWESEVRYKERDLEVFAQPLREQQTVVFEERVRKVKKSKVERRFKTSTVTTFRRDWKCYRSQAVKELIQDQRARVSYSISSYRPDQFSRPASTYSSNYGYYR